MNEELPEEPEKRFGYWVDLKGATFSDEDPNVSWIQAVPIGTYTHPTYGKLEFDMTKIRNMESNVNTQVRNTLLDIDYDHRSTTGKAAGWVTAADARADGLYVKVEWTETATEAIKQGEYKYFSPEFQDRWKHPKTGKVHKDVLFGGALTNRPFLKDILPVNLSELVSDQGDQNMSDEFITSMRNILGLNEEATETEISTELERLVVQDNETEAVAEEVEVEEEIVEPELVLASEDESDELTALAEDHPEVKALTERIHVLETANRLSEVNLKLQEWDQTRPYAIPGSLRDSARKILSETTDPTVERFLDELTQVGMVALGETKVASHGNERSAEESFANLVNKALNEDPTMDYADAVSMVSKDNPQLFEDYRHEVFVKE